MKRVGAAIRRFGRRTMRRSLAESLAEAGGFGMLVFAAYTMHQVAGLIAGGVVLLIYGNRE
jgi:predicted RND superfamily exporter protein